MKLHMRWYVEKFESCNSDNGETQVVQAAQLCTCFRIHTAVLEVISAVLLSLRYLSSTAESPSPVGYNAVSLVE